ncbi:hypothetical protein BCR33DRAFT_715448 [Rhizoclosmatium globosum]|uniref:Uncharacterized protein n=1 Tax=Rhizoclosmatium globosum TaxID=329046 RepID=A0A1Y2CH19_9FUNG|nr:hypothetical protein BCR33DRAFT_715448 [Rhizoclosmatium globosum]|eukprot:ORY46329.1 hypothetical protein BCR33DRAFT_715448 [Rhizoclosmatium globosum]
MTVGSSWLTALPSLAPTLFPASSASASTSLVDCVSVTASTSGSVVRLLNLARVKKSAENSKAAIQELSPGVPFEVKSLALSSNGKLLALAGEFHVAVMVLPPSLKYSAALKTSETLQTVREVKLHTIGDVYHSQNSSPIAKVAWHPLSESHCHLVVLTADGILRMYDMSSDPSEPEQVAYFSDQSVFGIDLDEREAVSFAFGHSPLSRSSSVSPNSETFQGWTPFAVYGLMKSGHIYVVCPFIPFKSVWSYTYLTLLKSFNESEWKSTKSGKNKVFLEKQFYWRNRWLDEAIDSANAGMQEQLPSDVIGFSVSRNLQAKLVPTRQGPVSLVPEDGSGAGDDDFAVDLFSLETEATSVFVAAFESGTLNVCVEVGKVCAKWNLPEEDLEGSAPTFLLYERIQLVYPTEEANAGIKIHTDPNHSDAFFVSHSKGAHLVSLRPVTQTQPRGGPKELFNSETHISSDVQCLVDLDFSYWRYSSGYSFLVTTSSNQLLAIHYSSDQAIPLQQTSVLNNPASKIHHQYSPFETPAILNKQQPLIVSQKDTAEPIDDDALLKTMAQKVTEIRTDIAAIKAAGLTVQHRVEDVQEEAIKQHKALESYQAIVENNLTEQSRRLDERVEKTQKNLESMHSRVDAVLQLLMDQTQPELSPAELAFMEELKELGSRIRSHLKPRLGQVQRQKELLLKQAETVKAQVGKSFARSEEVLLDALQVQKMDEALAFEFKLLTETWKKVDEVRNLLK